mmetsp:Transcript_6366/g.17000  ORF Transcript_6366/g.17000 Transcript_6366/m.17000 type:complete len:110 (-) Transcript_6366:219-548(-)
MSLSIVQVELFSINVGGNNVGLGWGVEIGRGVGSSSTGIAVGVAVGAGQVATVISVLMHSKPALPVKVHPATSVVSHTRSPSGSQKHGPHGTGAERHVVTGSAVVSSTA